MAYTDFTFKVIDEAWGIFDLTLTGTVEKGGLLTRAGIEADKDTGAAECVALDDGVSGDVIKVALAAVVRKQPTVATGGGVTAADHGGVAGTLLYLGDNGGAQESAGTYAQAVGWCIDTERAMLIPMQYATGTTIAATGACTIAGATTLTTLLTCSSKATISQLLTCSSKATLTKLVTCSSALTVTKTLTASSNTTLTKAATCSSALTVTKTLTASSNTTLTKAVTCSSVLTVTKSLYCSSYIFGKRPTHDGSSSKTLTSTQSGMVFTNDTDAKVYTLPATAPGLIYTFVNIGASTACQIEIDPNASDKFVYQVTDTALHDGDKLVNTKATMNKGDSLTICGDPTGDGWLVLSITGTWAGT